MNNEDDKIIKKFIILVIIVLLVAVGIYFLTKYAIKKDTTTSTDSTKTSTDVSIDYTKCIVGNMLNKNESEYYVILYDSNDSNKSTYTDMVTNYAKEDKHLAVYTVDLSNKLNTKYYTVDATNPISDNVNDLKFGDITVIKVKDSKITNAYESVKDIKKVWKLS